jgi:hypothetical protein
VQLTQMVPDDLLKVSVDLLSRLVHRLTARCVQ